MTLGLINRGEGERKNESEREREKERARWLKNQTQSQVTGQLLDLSNDI